MENVIFTVSKLLKIGRVVSELSKTCFKYVALDNSNQQFNLNINSLKFKCNRSLKYKNNTLST